MSAEAEPPFPGLRALRPDEAHRLRGRAALVDDLAARLHAGASLVIVGPPGVGRSSLLAAGLLPALRDAPRGDPGAPAYRASPPRGILPVLIPTGFSVENIIVRTPALSGRVLPASFIGHVWSASAAGLTLVVLVDDADVLTPANLAALTSMVRVPAVRLVLAVADADCPAARLVPDAAVVTLDPPPPDALAAMLDDGGVPLTAGLADAMVAEVRDDPAAALWLQFAARRLWETRARSDAPLTHAALRALGGVRGALTGHAERALASRPQAERDVAPAVLEGLVTPEGAAPLVARDDLLARAPAASRDAASSLLDALVDAGLLVARGARVELAHAALASAWPAVARQHRRLTEAFALRAQLRDAAAQWERDGRPRASHCPAWMRRAPFGGAPLTDLERAFLDAGRRHARRRALGVCVAALALALLAYVATSSLVRARDAAAEALSSSQLALAQARERLGARRLEAMAARARTLDLRDPEAGLVMALAAHDRAVAEALPVGPAAALVRQRARVAPARRLVGHGAPVTAAAFSPDGSLLATVAADGTARLWDVARGRPLARIDFGARGGFAAFSGDGLRVAVATSQGTVVVARARDGAVAWSAPACATGARWVGWSRDGGRVLVGCASGAVGALDASTGARAWWREGVALRGASFETDGVRVLWRPSPACCNHEGDPSWAGDNACASDGEAIALDAATGVTRSTTLTSACDHLPLALDPDGAGLLLGSVASGLGSEATPHDRHVSCSEFFPTPWSARVAAPCDGEWVVFGAGGASTRTPLPRRDGGYFAGLAHERAIVTRTEDVVTVWAPGARSPRLRVALDAPGRLGTQPLALSPSGDELVADLGDRGLNLWSPHAPGRRDPASLRAWVLPRTNLRVCRGSLTVVVVTDGALSDSPWAPDALCARAEASP